MQTIIEEAVVSNLLTRIKNKTHIHLWVHTCEHTHTHKRARTHTHTQEKNNGRKEMQKWLNLKNQWTWCSLKFKFG